MSSFYDLPMAWWQRVLLGLLLLAHGALMWLLASLLDPLKPGSELLVGATMGVFFGQGILASLWLVCRRDSRWWRGLCVLLLAAWAWLAMMLGIKSSGPLPQMAAISVGLKILLCLLASSGVLSVAWRIGRWEIRSPGDANSFGRQFSLQRSLAMMAMACVFLAVARQVMPPWNSSIGDEFAILTAQLTVLLIAAAIASAMLAVNCCFMLPVIAVMFRLKEHRWLPFVAIVFLGVPLYGAFIAMVEMALVLLGAWVVDSYLVLALMLLVTNAVQCFTIVLSLALLQAIGFRLERSRKHQAWSDSKQGEMTGSAVLPLVSVHDPHRGH